MVDEIEIAFRPCPEIEMDRLPGRLPAPFRHRLDRRQFQTRRRPELGPYSVRAETSCREGQPKLVTDPERIRDVFARRPAGTCLWEFETGSTAGSPSNKSVPERHRTSPAHTGPP